MNNTNKDDFERMVQLAEFGAKRHDERRQVEFRVFISYNTLLVLVFYHLKKIEDLNEPGWVTAGLVVIHITYLLWQIRLSIALVNDANRRNFYLKKAECILDHLRKHPNLPFHPRRDVCVTISLGSEVHQNSECAEKGKYLNVNYLMNTNLTSFWSLKCGSSGRIGFKYSKTGRVFSRL